MSGKGLRFLLLIQLFSSEKQKCPDHCVYSETAPPPLMPRETFAKRRWGRKGGGGVAREAWLRCYQGTGQICRSDKSCYFVKFSNLMSGTREKHRRKPSLKPAKARTSKMQRENCEAHGRKVREGARQEIHPTQECVP